MTEGRATSTRALLLLGDQLRARERGGELTMSGVGGCRKRAGFQIHGYEPDNPTNSVQAAIGSAVHQVVSEAVAALNRPGDLTEISVSYAGLVGHIDRFEAKDARLVDVKTTSTYFLESIQVHGIPESHRFQTALYAAGLESTGVKVRTIRLDYLVRDTGQEWQFERHFNIREVRDALEWVKFVREFPFVSLPRDYEPESAICQGCPFFNQCWEGYVPDRDKRSVMLAEGADVIALAEELFQLRRRAKKDKDREGELKGILDGLRPDTPGVVVKAGLRHIKWTAGNMEGRGQQLRFTAPPQKQEKAKP